MFRGRALQVLEKQVLEMGHRRLHIEERDQMRTLVLWDSRAHEAVLEVAAQDRLVTADQPDPAWAATTRQWWSRLAYQGGSWWVVDQGDLTPDRWWPGPSRDYVAGTPEVAPHPSAIRRA